MPEQQVDGYWILTNLGNGFHQLLFKWEKYVCTIFHDIFIDGLKDRLV